MSPCLPVFTSSTSPCLPFCALSNSIVPVFDHTLSLDSTMSAICFVCSLPILSHQVGLVWKGGSGADEFAASQPILTRRRDSTAPPPGAAVEPLSPPGRPRRRRSSLAQLTDLIRDWGRGGGDRRRAELARCETVADAPPRSLPLARRDSDSRELPPLTRLAEAVPPRAGRRQSLAEGSLSKGKRRGESSDLRSDISRLLACRETMTELWRKRRETKEGKAERGERRPRRQSATVASARDAKPPPSPDGKYIEPRALIEARQAALLDHRDSESHDSAASRDSLVSRDSGVTLATGCEERQSPTPASLLHRVSLPTITPLAPRVHPRGCISPEPSLGLGREPSGPAAPAAPLSRSGELLVSPDVTQPGSPRPGPLRRQGTTVEESSPAPRGRSGSRPFLSPDPFELEAAVSLRARRRDSLSPDSAAEEMNMARRLKSHRLSGEESGGRSRRGSPHALHRWAPGNPHTPHRSALGRDRCGLG